MSFQSEMVKSQVSICTYKTWPGPIIWELCGDTSQNVIWDNVNEFSKYCDIKTFQSI